MKHFSGFDVGKYRYNLIATLPTLPGTIHFFSCSTTSFGEQSFWRVGEGGGLTGGPILVQYDGPGENNSISGVGE